MQKAFRLPIGSLKPFDDDHRWPSLLHPRSEEDISSALCALARHCRGSRVDRNDCGERNPATTVSRRKHQGRFRRWDGTNWTLYAGETATPTSFYYCARVQLANADHRGGMACSGGGIRTPGVYLPTTSPAQASAVGSNTSSSTAYPKTSMSVGSRRRER